VTAGDDVPFFMTVFFSTAHFPYAAQAPYYRRFIDKSYRGPFLYYKPPLVDVSSPADVAAVQALYDGAIAAADAGREGAPRWPYGRWVGPMTRLWCCCPITAKTSTTSRAEAWGHGDHLEGDQSLRVPVADPRSGTSISSSLCPLV
jgi:hypothetical protein